mgnify:CR=1 FL=1
MNGAPPFPAPPGLPPPEEILTKAGDFVLNGVLFIPRTVKTVLDQVVAGIEGAASDIRNIPRR